ncbi:MAG: hypothetical protein ACXW4P_03975 [Thermoanaerobaculia bacterium]
MGSFIGIMIGVALVLYLDSRKSLREVRRTAAVTSTVSVTQTPPKIVEPPVLDIPRIIEIAPPTPAVEAERVLQLLEQKHTQQPDTLRPEMLRYLRLPKKEMEAEVKIATSEVAAYVADGVYAPERHSELYRKVNLLWDVPRQTDRDNRWLAQAVAELNKLAMRHIEEAWQEKDAANVVGTATALDEWVYRLDPQQEERLKTMLKTIIADAGVPDDA